MITWENPIKKRYLCNSRTQKRPHEEPESFELSLNDDEPEIRFSVGVTGLQFHQLDL